MANENDSTNFSDVNDQGVGGANKNVFVHSDKRDKNNLKLMFAYNSGL